MKTLLYTIALCFPLLLLVSCGEDKKGNESSAEAKITASSDSLMLNSPNDKICEDLIDHTTRNLTYSAFDSFDAGFSTTTGDFDKKMYIPVGEKQIQGQRVVLRPAIISRENISKDGVYAIFEVLKHNKNDDSDLSNYPFITETQTGNLGSLTPPIDPSVPTKIYVASMHDEDFDSYTDEEIAELKAALIEIFKECQELGTQDCLLEFTRKKDSLGITKPATLGGGVIPPR